VIETISNFRREYGRWDASFAESAHRWPVRGRPSAAKAAIDFAAYGAAEAAPLQGKSSKTSIFEGGKGIAVQY